MLVSLRPSAITVHTERPEHTSTRNVWAGHDRRDGGAGRPGAAPGGAAPSALVDVTPAAVAELDLDVGREVWLSAKATEVEVYADPVAPQP